MRKRSNGENGGWESGLTKPLLRGASALNDLYDARPKWFDRRDVIRENTHVTGGRRQVDLHDVCGGEDRLRRQGQSLRTDSSAGKGSEQDAPGVGERGKV